MEKTHPPRPSGDEPSPASKALAAVPASAAQTLIGLQALIGQGSRIPLDVGWIAEQLFPGMPAEYSADRIVRDVLLLEDAGHVVTWAHSGREWLALSRPGFAPSPAMQEPPGPRFESPSTVPFSSAWKREKEREEEQVREQARARARALTEAESQAAAVRWEAEYSNTAPRQRPQRPARLNAPPLGCPNHPHGTVTEECGACGTAMERRRDYFASVKYEQQLVLFEESQWEGFDSETF